MHIHVYDDDVVGRDSVGSAKIDLKKHVFGKGRYDQWVKLPAMLGLKSNGEIHLIIEHHVCPLFSSLLLPSHLLFLALKQSLISPTELIFVF